MSGMRIEVDRGLCMGAGECVYSAPKAFALDDEGKSVVTMPEAESEDAIRNAVRGCPNFAIRIVPSADE